ncbi:MAG: RES domain-containing protein [Flavobacteriales bacterium]|nr:MAG: RES domain-containing protein [Flavobacteriales bacterium]
MSALRERDLSEATTAEIKQAFFDAVVICPFVAARIKSSDIGRAFYRARKNPGNPDDPSQYSYPNPDQTKVHRLRANLEDRPVFYGSDLPFTAFLEVRPGPGDEVFLSEWSLHCTRQILQLGFLPGNMPSHNPWFRYAVNQHLAVARHTESLGAYGGHIENLYQYVAHLFAEEESPYPLSSMLADSSLYGDDVDCIVYPSQGMRSEQCNIAVHPRVIDAFGELQRVARLEVVRVEQTYRYKLHQVGYPRNGKIQWEAPTRANTNWNGIKLLPFDQRGEM